MLRVAGRVRVLHVASRALRSVRAGHGAVLLGYEPGPRASLRLNIAAVGRVNNLSPLGSLTQ